MSFSHHHSGRRKLSPGRVKTVLQSVEQRRDGRAMAASTFYLVSNLKINPIPVQGSEKTSGVEL